MVRTDSGITSIEQLAGKKVKFSDVGSGTQLSSRDIFSRLGIKVTEENMGQKDAFEALKSGAIKIPEHGQPAPWRMPISCSAGSQNTEDEAA